MLSGYLVLFERAGTSDRALARRSGLRCAGLVVRCPRPICNARRPHDPSSLFLLLNSIQTVAAPRLR